MQRNSKGLSHEISFIRYNRAYQPAFLFLESDKALMACSVVCGKTSHVFGAEHILPNEDVEQSRKDLLAPS